MGGEGSRSLASRVGGAHHTIHRRLSRLGRSAIAIKSRDGSWREVEKKKTGSATTPTRTTAAATQPPCDERWRRPSEGFHASWQLRNSNTCVPPSLCWRRLPMQPIAPHPTRSAASTPFPATAGPTEACLPLPALYARSAGCCCRRRSFASSNGISMQKKLSPQAPPALPPPIGGPCVIASCARNSSQPTWRCFTLALLTNCTMQLMCSSLCERWRRF